jgi:O-antigen ligase
VLACVVAGVVSSGAVAGFAGGLAPSTSGPPPAPAAVVARDAPPAPLAKRDALHGRGDIWRAGLEAFGQRPLQGHGAASFLPATLDLQQRRLTAYGHNLPLELGVELGLAGVLLGLSLYLVVLRACWRARSTRDAWLLAVPCVAFLVANMVDWPWHIAGLGAVWAAATGALMAGSFAGACTSADGPLGRGRATLRMQPTEVGQR